MQRRKYTPEFKRETVELANQSGIILTQLGSELGISAGMIGRWRRELLHRLLKVKAMHEMKNWLS